jgi:hypothetical protein
MGHKLAYKSQSKYIRNMKTLGIIGDGVAARALLFYLYKNGLDKKLKIIQIHSPETAPPCSLNTTGVNCLRGIERGISPLGDLIMDSYEYFEDFVTENKPDGIEKFEHFQIWDEASEKHKQNSRRFSGFQKVSQVNDITFNKEYCSKKLDAYLIYPETILQWLGKEFKHQVIKDHVIEVNEKVVCRNSAYEFDFVVVAANAFSKLMNVQDEGLLEKSKPIIGSYYEFKKKLDMPSFSISLGECNLIYRAQTSELVLGATTLDRGFQFTPDMIELGKVYNKAASIFGDLIPPEQDAKVKTGIRHKGRKRMPFWGKVNNTTWCIHSLYKNGWIYPFKAGSEVTQMIVDSLS